MNTTTTSDLGDQLRLLATWVDRTPVHRRAQVELAVDHLALLLGEAVADVPAADYLRG